MRLVPNAYNKSGNALCCQCSRLRSKHPRWNQTILDVMSGCLQVTTHFSKTTSKQSRTGKSDVIDVLYCIYSALKQLHKVVCLGGNVILRWPSTSAFRPAYPSSQMLLRQEKNSLPAWEIRSGRIKRWLDALTGGFIMGIDYKGSVPIRLDVRSGWLYQPRIYYLTSTVSLNFAKFEMSLNTKHFIQFRLRSPTTEQPTFHQLFSLPLHLSPNPLQIFLTLVDTNLSSHISPYPNTCLLAVAHIPQPSHKDPLHTCLC